jgi:methylated-DNA-[protein]-cysteine S-methyltransferase
MRKRRRILSDISKNSSLSLFEKRVLRAVLDIPKGETRSYGWVAAKIGAPRAARAVGNALNKNPYAPSVPCHRVIRSDGSLGGYARGRPAKAEILKSEGVDCR